MTEFWAALTLQAGYNASLVAIGAALLGIAAGAAGSFVLLRKRALVSDAVAHAALPGIVLAFMVMVAMGGDGRALAGLLIGAGVSGTLGLLAISWITRHTRLAEDAAMGAVLGVFFGLGIVLLTVVQTMRAGRQAGLEDFLLGATAGMLREDALLIGLGGAVVLTLCWLLRRPMTLVAFDAAYAATQGYNTRAIDMTIMALAMAVTLIGLKLVGLVLIVALLIIPPVAARFWTERAGRMVWIAGAIGGAGAYTGAAISATAPDLPTGPIIVLVLAAGFTLSMLFAPARGTLWAALRHARMRRRLERGA
jgi:manganese/zinc/iron transport system permease protein